MQGVVIAIYFLGYMCTQIHGGYLAEQWSAKWTATIGITIPAFLTIITPFVARSNVFLLCVLRVLLGATHALFNSTVYYTVSIYASKAEMASAVVSLNSHSRHQSI